MIAKNKRVIVFSNNCFSPSNTNGRTLGNLFHGWPRENLAQMCVIAQDPDWDVCTNYYCLEDNALLHAFVHLRKAKGRRLVKPTATEQGTEATNKPDTQTRRIGRKTLPKVLLRELVWAFNRWRSKDFEQWVDDFQPDVVVLQFTDTAFLLDIALYVAKSRGIPLVVYSTEGFYFFDQSWYAHQAVDAVLFPPFLRRYRRKVRRLMDYASAAVYVNSRLRDDYDREFHMHSPVISLSSSIEDGTPPQFSGSTPRVSYLGNLGLDRPSALIDVAEVLQSLDERFTVDVYGRASEEVQRRFQAAKGIVYHGMVSYDKVREVIAQSDILLHAESEYGHRTYHLQYAFSGKIADCIASGKCFVLYAPQEVACGKYIRETGAGWYAATKDDLRAAFLRILNNPTERAAVLAQAKQTAAENHSFEKNAERFQEILINA